MGGKKACVMVQNIMVRFFFWFFFFSVLVRYKISIEVSRILLQFNGKVICEHSEPSDPIMAPANSLIMTVRRHPMAKSIGDLCTYWEAIRGGEEGAGGGSIRYSNTATRFTRKMAEGCWLGQRDGPAESERSNGVPYEQMEHLLWQHA